MTHKNTDYCAQLQSTLACALKAHVIEVIDDSARHAGHAGARAGGNTHFKVRVVSAEFADLSRIARHRLVFDALKDEMATQIHALNIVALTPEEADRQPHGASDR